eukprot:1136338-Pelagomonas_calceolata.AAC.8
MQRSQGRRALHRRLLRRQVEQPHAIGAHGPVSMRTAHMAIASQALHHCCSNHTHTSIHHQHLHRRLRATQNRQLRPQAGVSVPASMHGCGSKHAWMCQQAYMGVLASMRGCDSKHAWM